jgi:enoyl-CoA hydratase
MPCTDAGPLSSVEVDITELIATLVLERPPVNALDDEVVQAMKRALDEVDGSDARVMIWRSSSDTIFSAGADISYIEECISNGAEGMKRMLSFVKGLQDVLARIESHPLPSIALIEGAAVGGGMEFALACDIRVAGAKARFGLPEAKIGLLPGAGGTQRLTRIAGSGVSSRMILESELIGANEAKALGIVQHLAEAGEASQEAYRIARSMAAIPLGVLDRVKKCIAIAPTVSGYEMELQFTAELLDHDSTLERIKEFLGTHGERNESK